MAKALIGSMHRASIGPNVLGAAARAGVLADSRHEGGADSEYMRELGKWVLRREVHASTQCESIMEHDLAEETEKILMNASAAADKVIAELVEFDLDAQLEESALV